MAEDRAGAVSTVAAQARRRAGRRRGLVIGVLSLAGHLAVLAVLAWAPRPPTPLAEPTPIAVALVEGPRAPAPEPPAPSPPQPAPPPPRELARPTRAPPPDAPTLAAGQGKAERADVELSDAQLASATPAGAGGGGRPCDMAQRLQTALRKDSRVQAAIAEARSQASAGKPLFVWNGEWIRSRGQEGEGLAAVREAIMWEVAFAPEACRAEPVHGLVLLSMNDGAGGAGLVMGSGVWRWSDLLRPRPAG